MARELECNTCGKKFIPGKTGANGLCSMHDRRERRNSPNARNPNPLRNGKRSFKVGGYVSEDVANRVTLLTAALGKSASEWVAEKIEAALTADEKEHGLK